MKMKLIGAAVAATLLGFSAASMAAGAGVGGSAGGTGASPVDTPREAGRSEPGANPDATGPQGAATTRCDNLTGNARTRCLRDYSSSTGTSTTRGHAGVGGSAGGTGASPIDTPREAGRSAPGANPNVTGPQGARR